MTSTRTITRGVATGAVSVLAVGALPFVMDTAHAAVTEVEIVNVRDRHNFDPDELRDRDDFIIQTRNEVGEAEDLAGDALPQYRWTVPAADGVSTVSGNWMSASRKTAPAAVGRYVVRGPNRGVDDGLRDRQLRKGVWKLEVRVDDTGAIPEASVTVSISESEITLVGDGSVPAGGTSVVTGTLANDGGGLAGRGVVVSYAPAAGGDAAIEGAVDNTLKVTTDAEGGFSVTLQDPAGLAGERGVLTAKAFGEGMSDATQLWRDYAQDDSTHPEADAMASWKMKWEDLRAEIVARLKGRNNGARDDRLRVVAPTAAHGAEVRLLKKVRNGRLRLLQTKRLNRRGDRLFVVNDRNRRRITSYVAVVSGTDTTRGDRTGVRRVR